MNIGTNIRRNSIAVSAMIGSIGGSVIETVVGDVFANIAKEKGRSLPIGTRIITLIILSIIMFLVCLMLLKFLVWLSSKSVLIRRTLFGEKIVEGKWIEAIYYDPGFNHIYCFGVTNTYYDERGELRYEGTDYDYRTFRRVGSFTSEGSSLNYDRNASIATLTYIYDFTNHGVSQRGYGQIEFDVGKKGSENHTGVFYNSDGQAYYFIATLIKNKEQVKLINNGGEKARQIIQRLAFELFSKEGITQKSLINDMYLNDPHSFNVFTSCEDSEHNLYEYFKSLNFANSSVLDIGAGTGRFSFYIINSAKKIVCTDASEKMVSYLRNIIEKEGYNNKCSVLCCDHMLLPIVLHNQRFDCIIAGFTLGTYFNDNSLSRSQKEHLFNILLNNLKSLLKDNGELFIIESLGLGDNDECKLLSFDEGLTDFFELLDRNSFVRKELSTDFYFSSEEEANRTISTFWGSEGVEKIKYNALIKKYVLPEKVGIWRKKINNG